MVNGLGWIALLPYVLDDGVHSLLVRAKHFRIIIGECVQVLLDNHAARQSFGRVAIANSDAGGDAYAHLAISEAERAVRELLG